MDLIQVQRFLAPLYTDAGLRARFFADPERARAALGLSPGEARHLAQLSEREVQRFAHSLQAKRLNEAGILLPLTRQSLGAQFAPLFRRYAGTAVPNGPKKDQIDAIRFAGFIERVARRESIQPAWAADVARFEVACLRATDCWCVGRRFRCGMQQLLLEVAQGAQYSSPSTRPTLAIWLRLPWKHKVWHGMFSLPRLCPRRARIPP